MRAADVQEAHGELAARRREGLLALSVGVGLGVLTELMADEVDDVVARKAVTTPWLVRSRREGTAGKLLRRTSPDREIVQGVVCLALLISPPRGGAEIAVGSRLLLDRRGFDDVHEHGSIHARLRREGPRRGSAGTR